MQLYKFYKNLFFPYSLKELYEDSHSWPDEGKDVDENTFAEFSASPPPGKIRGTNDKGLPTWVDAPPPTYEEEVEAAEQQRQQLLSKADEVTADWRVELMLGDISEEDKEKLSAWMDYKKQVKAVDASTAPDITWPIPPAE